MVDDDRRMAPLGIRHDTSPDAAPPPNAVQWAARALRLCLDGDGDTGLALYDRHMTTSDAGSIALGFQARLIEQAGHPDTATKLRNLAVRRGFDVSWHSSLATTLPPAITAGDYERLFAAGYANSIMIDRYLQALTALGRTDTVAAIFDLPRLLYRTTIGDAAAVAQALLDAEADIPFNDRVQISYAMRSSDLHRLQHPIYDALLKAVRAEMSAYLARLADSDHPFAARAPQDFSIESWSMIAGPAGHNIRHNHPRGWVTGVYYPTALPPGSVGGTLRVGGWTDPPPPGWPDETIVPTPGLLVLMPSWYVHWTEPTRSNGRRLSIAIDAVRT